MCWARRISPATAPPRRNRACIVRAVSAYDANNNRLFSVDDECARVLVFNVGPSAIANGMNASYVLGPGDFVTCLQILSQSGMTMTAGNSGLTSAAFYDPGSGRVFVTDTDNSRIMIFEGSAISAPAQWHFIPGYE